MRRLQAGPGWLVLVAGPLAGSVWSAARELERALRPTVWALTELPSLPIPEEFQADLFRSRRLLLVEEHVEQGGVAQNVALALATAGIVPERFVARSARGYLTGRFGSQDFHRRECGLDGASIVRVPSTQEGQPRCSLRSRAPRGARSQTKASCLQGPILVLGASGFVGANLMRSLFAVRGDVYGTTTRKPAWRLEGLPEQRVRMVDLLVDSDLDALFALVRPRTIFHCVAYGAYSFETDSQLIYHTNFQFVTRLLPLLESRSVAAFVHAGSSSEYGDNAAGPSELDPTAPNSDYAVSKVAASNLIYYHGKRKGFPCANLRLYSVFGPLEDSARLIPSLVRHGLEGRYPEFVSPTISRDFVYVDDVTEAFVDTALNLRPDDYGESFNIGTGCKTTIGQVARAARKLFAIAEEPCFTMPEQHAGTCPTGMPISTRPGSA